MVGFDFSPSGDATAARSWRSETASTSPSSSGTSSRSGRDYAHAFDGVWEYTCFCAIDPARRDAYVRTIATILKPGGWLLACFFPMRRVAAGPPFPVSEAEVSAPLWGRASASSARSRRSARPARRQGLEWLVLARYLG